MGHTLFVVINEINTAFEVSSSVFEDASFDVCFDYNFDINTKLIDLTVTDIKVLIDCFNNASNITHNDELLLAWAKNREYDYEIIDECSFNESAEYKKYNIIRIN